MARIMSTLTFLPLGRSLLYPGSQVSSIPAVDARTTHEIQHNLIVVGNGLP